MNEIKKIDCLLLISQGSKSKGQGFISTKNQHSDLRPCLRLGRDQRGLAQDGRSTRGYRFRGLSQRRQWPRDSLAGENLEHHHASYFSGLFALHLQLGHQSCCC
jgi:hypothetical protein